jgi:hypothetical protein
MNQDFIFKPQILTAKSAEFAVLGLADSFVKPLIFEKAFGDNPAAFLGRQIKTTVKITLPKWYKEKVNINTGKYEKIPIPSSEIILDTVLVDIKRSKNIVETAVNGMDGTVKEFISSGDYQLTFTGAIVNKAGKGYPFSDVQKLQYILNSPPVVSVESELLSLFNIYKMVIRHGSYPPREGFTNTQLFAFDAVSDEPIELKL